MKKAINVLVLVSKILSIVLAVVYLILMIVNFAQAASATGPAHNAFVSKGIGNIFQLSFAIAAIIVTYINGPKMNEGTASKGEAIVSIVFGVLGCGTLAAAGIVYLVYLSHADKSQTSKAPEERSDSDQQ